jgi:glycosyltransferase involved in cell wall biosynthesis
MKWISLSVILLTIMLSNQIASAKESKFEKAKLLYYNAVDEEENIDQAIKLLEEIMKEKPSMKGVGKTYIGSLTAMKAAHTFWPHNKLDYANEGIDIMAEGVKLDPDNIESLFVQASTLYNLPFFFGKSDEAEANFKKIISLLNDNSMRNYDQDILRKAIDFILENAELNDSEKKKANNYKQKLAK